MSDYTLDQLRADAKAIRSFLTEELEQRKSMLQRHPSRAAYWKKRIEQAEAAIDAHRRESNYIASTSPHNRLPSQPVQAGLFEKE